MQNGINNNFENFMLLIFLCIVALTDLCLKDLYNFTE